MCRCVEHDGCEIRDMDVLCRIPCHHPSSHSCSKLRPSALGGAVGQAGIHIQVWKIGRRLEVRLRESSHDVPGTHRLLVHVMPLPAAVKPAAVDQKTRKHIKAGRLCCHITWHSPCANCGQQ